MKVRDKKWIRFRIYLVASFFIIGVGVIIARAYQLQVLERDKLGTIARAGYRGEIKLSPKRGTIYDREKHELAVSVEVGSIYVHPNLVQEKKKTASQLALNLNMPVNEVLSLISSKRSFVWVERRISPEKIRRVKSLGMTGVGFATETRRYYPGREIGANLLGFAGADNQGLEGLERAYDKILRGPEDILVQMRDALGRPFYVNRPQNDDHKIRNLILTIDKDIQYKAQQSLEAAVKKFRGTGGQCIIMDPETGEILAMAVSPSFNPNVFGNHNPSEWRNRAVTDCYEPGSAIKAFLLATALEKSIVSPNTVFFCENGKYLVSNHTIHDTKEHANLTVSDIVVLSSNIGAAKIGWELGYETFYEYMKRFGFGEKTGIDLIGEREGFIRPARESKQIDMATSFFGQGMSASSLQLVTAISAIANGGKLMKPYVVKAVTDQSGRVLKATHPVMVRRVISEETAAKTTRILEDVVSKKGTAPQAAIPGFRVAGKTGTSQKVDPVTKRYSKKNYVAVFIGFVPVERPRLAILVIIDEPKGPIYYGGSVAGPVFREVGSWALNSMRVNPQIRMANIEDDLNAQYAAKEEMQVEPEPVLENQEALPDFKGQSIREVLRKMNRLGIDLEIEGSGLAFDQIPSPGMPLDKVTSVKVIFKPPA
ncbi:MAG: transpeptidase family protein [Deltaproteobacteria bacterium]|nr:transpeptidase family protein [Deltaproteobacteria bacterium]